mmetsp:Transcript_3309/g.10925  ORF Transcript_3309/g.10925 Transcript_3309/m.10925 type:complete len:214 (-) Transcript_3309:502-1143(-)
METSQLKMTDTALANPLRMLSAYFTTAATKSPPAACSPTTAHAVPPKPCMSPPRPLLCMMTQSWVNTEITASDTPKIPSWMFFTQRVVWESLTLMFFSKYTDAYPDMTPATRHAMMPTSHTSLSSISSSAPPAALAACAAAWSATVCWWLAMVTNATPMAMVGRESHCCRLRFLPSIVTAKSAVGTTLRFTQIWKLTASRWDAPTMSSVCCMT